MYSFKSFDEFQINSSPKGQKDDFMKQWTYQSINGQQLQRTFPNLSRTSLGYVNNNIVGIHLSHLV